MIEFILNDTQVTTDAPAGMVLVDFVRRERRLTGSTVACREGDCGACTLLVGGLDYRAITSCISPLGNAAGKHVVTVEGLACDGLNPIQQALIDHAATQCGFCTPGIVMSLAGYLLTAETLDSAAAVEAMDGNICRCTGYKSIERAVVALVNRFRGRLGCGSERIPSLIECGLLPSYFRTIPQRLSALSKPVDSGDVVTGGGTDLFVQRPEVLQAASLQLISQRSHMKEISLSDGMVTIGAGCSIQDVKDSPVLRRHLPDISEQLKLFASTQIRQQGTVGGNIVNASPIGDFTIFLLALDPLITLSSRGASREVPLREFYQGYKKRDLRTGEILESIRFSAPDATSLFSFEKVSRRTHLDIASVNTACHLKVRDHTITYACLSAGGVGPIPMQLRAASSALIGKPVTVDTVRIAVAAAQQEVTPISDVRGSCAYKRLLLRQLIYAHFLTRFPKLIKPEHLL